MKGAAKTDGDGAIASDHGAALRRAAEKLLGAQAGRSDAGPAEAADVQGLLHELQVHAIELELQNEELRRAQIELEAVKARYFDLYALAPVGYVSLDGESVIRESNLTAAALLGLTVPELRGKHLSRFILKEDQDILYQNRRQLHEPLDVRSFELRMARADGQAFHARLELARATSTEGSPAYRLVILDISEQKASEAALAKALRENQGLLRELRHRVKNSFGLIHGMITLGAGADASPEVREKLEELGSRVWSVSELYSLLYSSEAQGGLSLDQYCARVVEPLVDLNSRLRFVLKLEPLVAPIHCVGPVGMILTELLTNTVKYAFPDGRSGAVTVTLRKAEGGARLVVEDDGVGFPPDFAPREGFGSGLFLVRGFAEQLGGSFSLENGPSGARCILDFPVEA
jgi:PAS domain S-box-containing protein